VEADPGRRPARFLNLSTLHGYVYGRWTNQYIKRLISLPPPGRRSGKWLSDRYHGKVLTKDQAEAIVTNQRDIPLQDLEQIVPYPVARDLVLHGPPDVAVYECACRSLARAIMLGRTSTPV